jgi:uncharacterized protein (TIGR00299 family) protein
MRIAYLECFSGISGDMFLGALVDAGVPADVLEKAVAALGVGAELRIRKVDRSGITATKVDVVVAGEVDRPRESVEVPARDQGEKNLKTQSSQRTAAENAENITRRHGEPWPRPGVGVPAHERGYEHAAAQEAIYSEAHAQQHRESRPSLRTGVSAPHDNGHEHEHGNEHEHGHRQVHEHGHEGAGSGHGRHLSEIKRIISAAAISAGAKRTAIAIFEALGAAEAKIHNVDVERVHFHEVGAVDAMVDIVGAAVGAEALGVDEIVCSPLNVGGGTVTCAHGVFPVPAPATVELLRGAPVFSTGVEAELVTPTGAAIVKTLAARFGEFPPMRVERAGYGAGSKDFAGHANVARLTIGDAVAVEGGTDRAEDLRAGSRGQVSTGAAIAGVNMRAGRSSLSAGAKVGQDTVAVLEANLDDLNPQVFGYVMERLLAEGALDVYGVPVQMKKNRPGMVLTILARPEDAEKLTQIVFAETSTLGVRRRDERRQVLGRRWETVATPWGEVRMKVASMNGTVTNYAPEYEDCRRIAEEQQVPLKSVMQEATRVYLSGAAGKKH